MNKLRKPFNHPLLGGDVVDTNPWAKKTNTPLTGQELLQKSVTGSAKKKTEAQLKNAEIRKILKKK
jgi:hypothetical protein